MQSSVASGADALSAQNEYRARAEQYAPKTHDEIQRVARELAAEGHGDYDVAWILGIDVAAARKLIGPRST
jgi:hypothetical protein